jgi:hypothetical protein
VEVPITLAFTGAGGEMPILGIITPLYNLSLLELPAGSEVNLGTPIVEPVFIYDQYGDESYVSPLYDLTGIPHSIGSTYGTGCTVVLVPKSYSEPVISLCRRT